MIRPSVRYRDEMQKVALFYGCILFFQVLFGPISHLLLYWTFGLIPSDLSMWITYTLLAAVLLSFLFIRSKQKEILKQMLENENDPRMKSFFERCDREQDD
jgi:hypothetical protein